MVITGKRTGRMTVFENGWNCAMKRILSIVTRAAILCILLQGCTTVVPPPIRRVDEDTLNSLINSERGLRKIQVFPFTGHNTFSMLAGEHFTDLLQKHHHIQTIGPKAGQDTLAKGAPLGDALANYEGFRPHQAGYASDVDAIIFGRVSPRVEDGLVVDVVVIDMETGGVILHTAISGAQQMALSGKTRDLDTWRQAVMLSTQSVAYDVISILHRLDGNTWHGPADSKGGEQ